MKSQRAGVGQRRHRGWRKMNVDATWECQDVKAVTTRRSQPSDPWRSCSSAGTGMVAMKLG